MVTSPPLIVPMPIPTGVPVRVVTAAPEVKALMRARKATAAPGSILRRPGAVSELVALAFATVVQAGANHVTPSKDASRTIVPVKVPVISQPAAPLLPSGRTTVLFAGAAAGVTPSQATESEPEAIWSAIPSRLLPVSARYFQHRLNHPTPRRRISLPLAWHKARRGGVRRGIAGRLKTGGRTRIEGPIRVGGRGSCHARIYVGHQEISPTLTNVRVAGTISLAPPWHRERSLECIPSLAKPTLPVTGAASRRSNVPGI